MKKIILLATVTAVFLSTLVSCKKTLKPFPESVIYIQPAFSSEHYPKALTLYTNSGIFNSGINFSPPVKESIRFISLISFVASHIITLWQVSDMATVAGTITLLY